MAQVSKFLFKDDLVPNNKNILEGFKEAVSDVIFNAIGTKTARKIASKVRKSIHSGFYLYLKPVNKY